MKSHQLAMALRGAYLTLHRQTNAAVLEHRITADQFVVLAALSEGDGVAQCELVCRTSSDPNTMRGMLVLLEKQGLIERRPHPTDSRVKNVFLTRKGRSVFKKAWRTSQSVRRRMAASMKPAEIDALTRQLDGLADGMEGEDVAPPRRRRRKVAASR